MNNHKFFDNLKIHILHIVICKRIVVTYIIHIAFGKLLRCLCARIIAMNIRLWKNGCRLCVLRKNRCIFRTVAVRRLALIYILFFNRLRLWRNDNIFPLLLDILLSFFESCEVSVFPSTRSLPVELFAACISLIVFCFARPVLILKIVLISNRKNRTTEIMKNKIVNARHM